MSEAKADIYIGLMSGTSIDGLDIAAVRFDDGTPSNPLNCTPQIIATQTYEYPTDLRSDLIQLCSPGSNEIDRMGQADQHLGKFCGECINQLIQTNEIDTQEIVAIASHGQTIRHRPNFANPFTLQIGDPNQIAAITNLTVVADFRRKDMALGGQGAPLAPAFHQAVLKSNKRNCVVLNLGGIANVTIQPSNSTKINGFDTGPANGLMNAWIVKCKNIAFDKNGDWARSGKVIPALLKAMLHDSYFRQPQPKSTGREHFNLDWLEKIVRNSNTAEHHDADIQRTLLELTAVTIADEIKKELTEAGEVIVCGGGVHNGALMERLRELLAPWDVESSIKHGVDPDFMEAIAFAWFAKQSLLNLTSSKATVTGASKNAVLGGIYAPP